MRVVKMSRAEKRDLRAVLNSWDVQAISTEYQISVEELDERTKGLLAESLRSGNFNDTSSALLYGVSVDELEEERD